MQMAHLIIYPHGKKALQEAGTRVHEVVGKTTVAHLNAGGSIEGIAVLGKKLQIIQG